MPKIPPAVAAILAEQVKDELQRRTEAIRQAVQSDDLSEAYSKALDLLALIDEIREPTIRPSESSGGH